MSQWIKKVHMYLGLLNLSILLVFGIAGLAATFSTRETSRVQEAVEVRVEEFTVPAPLTTDREVAEYHLHIAAVDWNTQRDAENNLVATFYTPGGPRRVTLREKENRIETRVLRTRLWAFLDNLHASANRDVADWRVRLWGYYNELAIWSLIAMSVTGLYLWLRSRPAYRWALVSFVVGSAAFAVLYVFTR